MKKIINFEIINKQFFPIMKYLICEHCGFENRFTQYLTFCKSCKQLLKNSQTNWLKENQGKTLEDYERALSENETLMSANEKTSSFNKYNKTNFLTFNSALQIKDVSSLISKRFTDVTLRENKNKLLCQKSIHLIEIKFYKNKLLFKNQIPWVYSFWPGLFMLIAVLSVFLREPYAPIVFSILAMISTTMILIVFKASKISKKTEAFKQRLMRCIDESFV